MCGHTEDQTVEAHITIFSILFSDKISGQFLEQHGSWVLFFFFSFLCVAVIEDDIFHFFFFFFHFFSIFFFLPFKV
ncbi:hypothetical protein TCDM_12635 [Trypanosoma cruzi Dm28c]|uniref:Uncharacterized protein n=1 Tax=Trypanosoma cruzi Dm28c TaxID=1416333 RepID=V5AKT7_TRYCR|nr:hypothetical protein TCDM_12635 [Trypanosoma cruzi Dm28c]